MQQSPTLDVLLALEKRTSTSHCRLFKNLPRIYRFPRRFFFFFAYSTPSSAFLSQVIITCIPILIPRTQLDTRRARIERGKRRLPSIRVCIYVEIIADELCERAVGRTKIKEISLTDWRNRFFRQRTLRTSFELFVKIRCCSWRVWNLWESIKKKKRFTLSLYQVKWQQNNCIFEWTFSNSNHC